MKILGTGLRGLVGSRIVEILCDKVDFEISDIDITNESLITSEITSSKAPIVLHLAAKASVDVCEEDKGQGIEGEAWKVNVLGTKYIARACSRTKKKLIYISTDFIFDGENPPYDESSKPNPINWYGVTKLRGEEEVRLVPFLSCIIIRLAFPYRAHYERDDFVRAVLKKLKKGEQVRAIVDQTFTPTFIDDIAQALYLLIQKNQEGTFQVAGSQWMSVHDAVELIAQTFGCDSSLISQTTRTEFFKNRAARPFRLEVKNDKITQLGFHMSTFEEGLKKIKQQL